MCVVCALCVDENNRLDQNWSHTYCILILWFYKRILIISLFILTIGPALHQYTINQFPIHFYQLWADISRDHMHRWFQQCPSCKVALSVRLLPNWPIAMDSRYQLHGRLHQCNIILFLKSCNDQEKENIIVAGMRDESLHHWYFMNDHDK